jgi:hypothetical protein
MEEDCCVEEYIDVLGSSGEESLPKVQRHGCARRIEPDDLLVGYVAAVGVIILGPQVAVIFAEKSSYAPPISGVWGSTGDPTLDSLAIDCKVLCN